MRSYSLLDRLRLLVAIVISAWWVVLATIAVVGAFIYDIRHDAATEGVVASTILALLVLLALILPGRLLTWLDQ